MINRIRNATTLALGRTYGDLIVLRVRIFAADGLNALLTKRVQLLEGRLNVAERDRKRLAEERDSLAKGTTAGEAGELAAELDDLRGDLGSRIREVERLEESAEAMRAEIYELRVELGKPEFEIGNIPALLKAKADELARVKALEAECEKLRESLKTVEVVGIVSIIGKTLQALPGEPVLAAASRVLRERNEARASVGGLERELRTASAHLDATTRERDHLLARLNAETGLTLEALREDMTKVFKLDADELGKTAVGHGAG